MKVLIELMFLQKNDANILQLLYKFTTKATKIIVS